MATVCVVISSLISEGYQRSAISAIAELLVMSFFRQKQTIGE